MHEMQVVLLRVGIDTGSGGIHGPLFSDGSFEYIPIPDRFRGKGVDARTYGNTPGKVELRLADVTPVPCTVRVAGVLLVEPSKFVTTTV